MTYMELVNELYSMVLKYRPEWGDNEETRMFAVLVANYLTEKDDDDTEMIEAGICPKCYSVGKLVTKQDRTRCTECGETFIEVIR